MARCLVDTNILLRLSDPHAVDHVLCVEATRSVQAQGFELCYTLQNAAEFWNVSTRPLDRNGHGFSVLDAERGLSAIENQMILLIDDARVYTEWRRLVAMYSVRGVQVHDARLAASMISHGVPRVLTLNDRDFVRYTQIEAVHPASLV